MYTLVISSAVYRRSTSNDFDDGAIEVMAAHRDEHGHTDIVTVEIVREELEGLLKGFTKQ